MAQCTGNCNCCPCLLKAQSIVAKSGKTTITVKENSLADLCICDTLCIGLFTNIPCESQCNRIIVTDGTVSLDVVTCNQYWRPCRLKCRTILKFKYLDDPALLEIITVKGGR